MIISGSPSTLNADFRFSSRECTPRFGVNHLDQVCSLTQQLGGKSRAAALDHGEFDLLPLVERTSTCSTARF